MKLHKRLIYIGTVIILLTFIASLFLVIKNTENDSIINYWINVLLAIFGSSIVMVLTSIGSYLSERKRYELQYATFARDFLLRAVRFLNLHHNTKTKAKEVSLYAGDIHSYYDSFAYEKNYEILGYFRKNSKRKEKVKYIQNSLHEYANEISRIYQLSIKSIDNDEPDFFFQTSITIREFDRTMDAIQELFSL